MTLILNSNKYTKSEDFTVEYSPPLKFKKIALQSFSMWVSWDNISKKYNNNTFKYLEENNWIELTIPDGNYTVRDLNYYMMKYFKTKNPPIQFGIVSPRQRISIKLEENYEIDLSVSELHKILGFKPMIYKDQEQEGEFIADISRGNDNIYTHCSIVEGSRINEEYSQVVFSFTNVNPPGSQISKTFVRPIFYPVKVNSIDRIRMWITNQKGERIDLKKQEVEYNFIIEDEENYLKKIYNLLLK